jgi:hypothetical protein
LPVLVTIGFMSRVSVYYVWRIVDRIYVLLTTLFILNDLPDSCIGLVVFIFYILHFLNRIGSMQYIIPQQVWLDVWMNNNITIL